MLYYFDMIVIFLVSITMKLDSIGLVAHKLHEGKLLQWW